MQIVKNFNEKLQNQQKLVVLLAEEYHLTARIQKNALEESGFEVCLVKSLDDLFSRVKTQKIDLLMVDVNFNGAGDVVYKNKTAHKSRVFALILRIKKASLNSHLKVCLTSIMPFTSTFKQEALGKIDGYILKPVPKEKMVQSLKKMFTDDIRKSIRIMEELNATIYLENEIIVGKMIDISNTGIHLVDSHKSIKKKIGSVLKIEIELPRYKEPILINAIIVRKTIEGYGLKILDVSLENKVKISKYIDKNGFGKKMDKYYL